MAAGKTQLHVPTVLGRMSRDVYVTYEKPLCIMVATRRQITPAERKSLAEIAEQRHESGYSIPDFVTLLEQPSASNLDTRDLRDTVTSVLRFIEKHPLFTKKDQEALSRWYTFSTRESLALPLKDSSRGSLLSRMPEYKETLELIERAKPWRRW